MTRQSPEADMRPNSRSGQALQLHAQETRPRPCPGNAPLSKKLPRHPCLYPGNIPSCRKRSSSLPRKHPRFKKTSPRSGQQASEPPKRTSILSSCPRNVPRPGAGNASSCPQNAPSPLPGERPLALAQATSPRHLPWKHLRFERTNPEAERPPNPRGGQTL